MRAPALRRPESRRWHLSWGVMDDRQFSHAHRVAKGWGQRRCSGKLRGCLQYIQDAAFEPFPRGSTEGSKLRESPWEAEGGPASQSRGTRPALAEISSSGGQMSTRQGCYREISCPGGWLAVETSDLWPQVLNSMVHLEKPTWSLVTK